LETPEHSGKARGIGEQRAERRAPERRGTGFVNRRLLFHLRAAILYSSEEIP
jgi:hypothetical protein